MLYSTRGDIVRTRGANKHIESGWQQQQHIIRPILSVKEQEEITAELSPSAKTALGDVMVTITDPFSVFIEVVSNIHIRGTPLSRVKNTNIHETNAHTVCLSRLVYFLVRR